MTRRAANRGFGADPVKTILGAAADAFAQDTFGVRKGTTRVANAHLVLQLQFALVDYGNTDDRCRQDELGMLT